MNGSVRPTPDGSAVGACVRVLGLALSLAAAPAVTFGAVTGDLHVRVLDPAGEPLAGARVSAESPALIGDRHAETSEDGVASFLALPPGTYRIDASADWTGTVQRTNVDVRPDRTTRITVELRPALTEHVTVQDRSPLLDTTSASVSQELIPELTRAVPLGTEYWDTLRVVPAVVFPEGSRHPWVHGGTGRDNLYLLDGVNTTDPVNGLHGTAFDYETVDRHEVTTAAPMAEYGGAVGLVSNVVTRSGGNEWSGGVHLYRTDASWGADFSPGAVASSRATAYTGSVQIGGPLSRDRLWIFASFQRLRTETETLVPEGSGPRPDRVDDSKRYFAKITWQPAPSHRLQLSSHVYDADYTNLNAEIATLSPDQFAILHQPTRIASLRYTTQPATNVNVDVLVAKFERDRDLLPQFPEAGPNHQVLWTSTQFGRYNTEESQRRRRDEFRVDANWLPKAGPGRHDLRFGAQVSRTTTSAVRTWSGGEQYWDLPYAGSTLWSLYGPGSSLLQRLQGLADHNEEWQCFLGGVACADQAHPATSFTDPSDWELRIDGVGYDPTALTFDGPSGHPDAASIGWVRSGRDLNDRDVPLGSYGQDLVAVYLQDDWQFGRVTLRVGARLERQRFRDSLGRERHTFDTTVGPRLGITVDPRADGRSKVYAHYARIYDPLRDDIAGAVGQMTLPSSQSQIWVAPAGDYFTWKSVVRNGTPGVEIPPGLVQQRTDEYVLGYARAFGEQTTLEVTAQHRETKHGIETLSLATGLGDPSLYPELQSGPTPASLGFPDRNGDGVVDADDLDGTYLICNMPGAGRQFRGIDVVVQRRLARRWQLWAGYSWSDLRGTLDDDATYWGVGDDPDWDPRLAHNDGRLWAPEHALKVYGAYLFPFGLEVGAGLRAGTGSHYGLRTVTPMRWTNWWNGDPARIVDTLSIDREAFSEAWGIPALGEQGARNPALDQAIVAAIPLDLRPGRGAYRNDFAYTLDLRFRYTFAPRPPRVAMEVFLDIFNVTDVQRATRRYGYMATVPGARVDPSNISDAAIYAFGTPTSTQSPRSYALGTRLSF